MRRMCILHYRWWSQVIYKAIYVLFVQRKNDFHTVFRVPNRAVVWSDFIQFVLIICAVVAVIFLGTYEIGSVSDVFAAARRGQRLKVFEYEFIKIHFSIHTINNYLKCL